MLSKKLVFLAYSNELNRPKRMPQSNLKRFLISIKSSLTRYEHEIYRALIVPKRQNWHPLNPQTFTKNNHIV